MEQESSAQLINVEISIIMVWQLWVVQAFILFLIGCALKQKCDFRVQHPDTIQFRCNKHALRVLPHGVCGPLEIDVPDSDEKDSSPQLDDDDSDSDNAREGPDGEEETAEVDLQGVCFCP